MSRIPGPKHPSVIFFDCAQTLLRVTWSEPRLIRHAAAALDVALPTGADQRYGAMHVARRAEYVQLNLKSEDVFPFWSSVLTNWLVAEGLSPSLYGPFSEICENLIYGVDSPFFSPYPDAVPALVALRDAGYRLAVVSNWDASLNRLLKVHGLFDFFELTVASLRVGVEKPDPAIFQIAMSALDVQPDDCFHVGDDPVDDGEGARAAGIRVRLIDRENPGPGYLSSLTQLPEAFDWTD
jgi:putative hydrolase of the HAD superfamily